MDAVTIKVEGAFLRIHFSTQGDHDQGGNGAYPSTLSFHADQTDAVRQDMDKIEIDFYGACEFSDFRAAIAVLAEELEALYGRAPRSNVRVWIERVREPAI
jgi:hypothetical protein